jgi:hypothetical protein
LIHVNAGFAASAIIRSRSGGYAAMSRFEAIECLLAALKERQPEEYGRYMHELLRSLGYTDIHDAFDDLLERRAPHDRLH